MENTPTPLLISTLSPTMTRLQRHTLGELAHSTSGIMMGKINHLPSSWRITARNLEPLLSIYQAMIISILPSRMMSPEAIQLMWLLCLEKSKFSFIMGRMTSLWTLLVFFSIWTVWTGKEYPNGRGAPSKYGQSMEKWKDGRKCQETYGLLWLMEQGTWFQQTNRSPPSLC